MTASQSLSWGSYEQSLFWQIVKAECSVSQLENFVPNLLTQINPDLHVEALSGLILALKGIHSKIIFDSILTLSPQFKLFPSDLLCCWFEQEPVGTIQILQQLCESLVDPETRDPLKVSCFFSFRDCLSVDFFPQAEQFLIQFTVWAHRSSSLKPLSSDFIQNHLVPLINEYDDNHLFDNLISVLGMFFSFLITLQLTNQSF